MSIPVEQVHRDAIIAPQAAPAGGSRQALGKVLYLQNGFHRRF